MRLGLIVRNSGVDAVRQVSELPALAEDLGFSSVWVSDHVLVPPAFAERYDDHWLEAVTALAGIASVTSRVSLGFSALILPYRPPALVASQVATLWEISGGRLVVGAGSGWLREEFAALGLDFAARGSATDAAIREIRARCGVEILAAGNSTRVLERSNSLCDGWHPIALSPADVAARGAIVTGRIVLRARFSLLQEDESRPLYGTPAKIRLDIQRYAAAGVDEIVLDYATRTHGEIMDSARAFADQVGTTAGEAQ